MQLQTFKADTMGDALQQVKHALGSDAVILHTRTYYRRYCLGLRRREVVEVTAGRGVNVRSRRPKPAPRRPVTAVASAKAAAPAPDLKQSARSLLETPAVNGIAVSALTNQMEGLKTLVNDLAVQIRRDRAPAVPEALLDWYNRLLAQDICPDIAQQVVEQVREGVRPEHLQQEGFVKPRLGTALEKRMRVSGPINGRHADRPWVVALIGPTGVGKTTTIAKLAAALKLREGRKVGLVTLDTYRIAAVDQLRKYADIIGSPLEVAPTPDAMRQAIDTLSHCEYVLIDTAGRSPNDTMKLAELRGFLAAARPDETHLVISCTSSVGCMSLAAERFCKVEVDKLIFSKVDEAPTAGAMFNVADRMDKPVSYLTTGQDVPDDIEVARPQRFAELLIGGAE